MKIKVKPEDFIVDEEAKIEFKRNGKFKVYLLTKKGFNTIDVFINLSKKFNIPFKKFAYGGRKDRYGLTTQYITVEGIRLKDVIEKSFKLSYLGDTDRPMGPDLILANEFKITIRDLQEEEIEHALRQLEFVKEYGYPNYFDDQRFGNYSRQQGFFAERLVKGEFNGSLKVYLTAVHPQDKKAEKWRKQLFFNNWRDWHKCLNLAKTSFEKEVFFVLLKGGNKSFLSALNLIPKDELSILISSYQAYLWNQLVERVVRFYNKDLLECRGNYWSYFFTTLMRNLTI
ncbi:MAG: tRNA pseudouridine(13) synthase TruD [Candidatus Omnitrophica bacterium]|nr:tRNA pseudouridine(13) synthase TruD [Candidatus Omnitrophota bacterium]